jgi:hypothetical protein
VSFLPTVSRLLFVEEEVMMGRSIGLDVHRDFCEIAVADGGRARSAGRVATTPDRLKLLACSLLLDDRVVLEATGERAGDRADPRAALSGGRDRSR